MYYILSVVIKKNPVGRRRHTAAYFVQFLLIFNTVYKMVNAVIVDLVI